MKYVVDKDICIGCGMCVSVCPEIFTMGDDGKAEAVAESTPETRNSADEAMEACPVAAIMETQI